MARPRTPLSSYGRIVVDPVEYVDGPAGADGERARRRLVVVKEPKPKHAYWRARARYRFEDGKLRQIERFAESGAKAEAALKKALAEIQSTAGVEVKRETRLRDLADEFLAGKSNRSPSTVQAYAHSIKHVIVPRIGDLAVAEATARRLQRFLDGVKTDHGLGAAKMARSVLSGMMSLATRADALTHNPVRELSAIEMRSKGATAVPLGELPALLAAARADKRLNELDMPDLIEFVAGTGARISEALGLAWEDVDLEAGTVMIHANVVRVPGQGVIRQTQTKTIAGARRITLPRSLIGILGDRRVRGGSNPHGLVFPTVLGNVRDPRNTARDWADARKRLSLPDGYTFHAFRKTVATALDQAGLSARDVAEYLGHADPSLTQSVYMSKTVGGSRAADALDGVLGS